MREKINVTILELAAENIADQDTDAVVLRTEAHNLALVRLVL
jgi:hypothetical protein